MANAFDFSQAPLPILIEPDNFVGPQPYTPHSFTLTSTTYPAPTTARILIGMLATMLVLLITFAILHARKHATPKST
jgi:hypothetical protein